MLDSLLGLFLIISRNTAIIKPVFLSILCVFFRRFTHKILIIFLIIVILINAFNPHSHFFRTISYLLSLVIVRSNNIAITPLVLQSKEIRTIISVIILLFLLITLQLAFLALFDIIKLCFNSAIKLSHKGLCSFLLIQLLLYISIHVSR